MSKASTVSLLSLNVVIFPTNQSRVYSRFKGLQGNSPSVSPWSRSRELKLLPGILYILNTINAAL